MIPSRETKHMKPTQTPRPILISILTTGMIAGTCLTTTAHGRLAAAATPTNAALVNDNTQLHSTAVSGSGKKSVTLNVERAAGGSLRIGTGLATAPAARRTYTLAATIGPNPTRSGGAQAKASPNGSIDPRAFLPADRATLWNPGLMAVGGIPARSAICSTLAPRGGALDDTSRIQAAIDDCPSGQVVQLMAGTFVTNNYVIINKGITLRGAGAGATILRKTNGAKMNQEVAPDAQPNIIIGPTRWPHAGNSKSMDLTRDGVKGSYSVSVANGSEFAAGQIVLLDELSGASWQPDRLGRGQIWASPDYRVVWQFHNPRQSWDDPLVASTPTSGAAASWFHRQDRVTAETKEVASAKDNTVTFTTPLHIDYRAAHNAQLSRHTGSNEHVKNAGVENLTVIGGSDGAIRFESAAYSWAKAVEVTIWAGEGISVNNSFRIEVRDSYIHDAAWAQPGGAGYAISLAGGSAEALFENNIVMMANKVIVARSAGAGSVFGYNYVDDGYINTIGGWIEVGLNASHMVGPHHVLFEGNYGFNWGSDHTHGNSIYHTVFRNYLRCVRSPFTNPLSGKRVDDATQIRNGPKRCVGVSAYSYWMSFIGNVLGAPGQMRGFAYDVTGPVGMRTPAIWLLGWDDISPQPYDPATAATTIRHGNFDYLTNRLRWDPNTPDRAIPDSLYLSGKPDFFNTGRGYTWPWVDPLGTTKLYTLPAKARYDAGTPFTQP